MTRQTTKQRGVSLVEVVLTLAITGLLLTTVLAGRSSLRSQAQFSDGMERIKENILSVKSEANTGNNTIGKGVDTSNYLTVGRSIHFTQNSNLSGFKTLLCNTDEDSQYSCLDKISFPSAANRTSALPWGIKYTGCLVGGADCMAGQNYLTLAFVRDDTNGSFTGYWYPNIITANMLRTNLYVNQTPITLMFKSSDGRTAKIDVNPATGAVTRTIE